MNIKLLFKQAVYISCISIMLCCPDQALPGGITAGRNADISAVSAEAIEKAKRKLHIVYFQTDPHIKLACTDSSIETHGARHTCNRGGFGNALHCMSQPFTDREKKLVAQGRTSWEKLMKTFLDTPGHGRFNVIVCPGGTADANKEKATAEYLTCMSRLESEYPEKTFVYMTGALDNTRIREFCRVNHKTLLDYADLGNNRIYAEWYLWAMIADNSEGKRDMYKDGTFYEIGKKSFHKLLADGKKADKKNRRPAAYINYRKALKLAEASNDIPRRFSRELVYIRNRIFSLETFADVKKEKEAWNAHDNSAENIRTSLERAKHILKNTAAAYPDTVTGKRAEKLAEELTAFIEKL